MQQGRAQGGVFRLRKKLWSTIDYKNTHLFVAFSAEDNEGGTGGKSESEDENEGEEELQTRAQVSGERSNLMKLNFPETCCIALGGARILGELT